jgi:hypothetical protein
VARTHGGGRACYKGFRPKSGSCEPCRTTNARQHTNHNRSESHRDACARYALTVAGVLSGVRNNAKRRNG